MILKTFCIENFRGIAKLTLELDRTTVPFAAISAFADPSVKFGLQFEAGEEDGGKTGQTPDSLRAELPAAGGESQCRESVKGAEVVALDAFRKK